MDHKYWLGYLSEWLGVVAVVMIAGISPLLKKVRRIDFRYPRREATFALSVFAICYLIAFQYFSNPFFDFLKNFSAYFGGSELAQRMVLALICLILFILALVFRGQPLKSIGWGKANMRAGLVTGLLMVVLVVFLRGKFGTILNGISAQEGQMLVIWLLLALAEETIFRGYIQLRLESYFGQKWGWLAAAALYLLWQMPGRLWITPLAEMWPTLLITLVQALLLGWVMRKSGHVLAPALYRAASGWLLLI